MRLLWLLVAGSVFADDLWLRHGKVWTADPGQPWAESVLIRGNRIAAVGTDAEVGRLAAGARVVELRGRLTVPGFNDAHLHFLGGSLSLGQVDLNGICTLDAMQKAIAAFAASHPAAPWVEGRGWEYLCFPQGRLPTREDLDKAVPDRPAYLAAYDGHTAWVNSKALAMAGISRDTPFSGFGEIVKDAKSGEPTGALKEGAMGLVRRLIPVPSRKEKLAALENGLRMAARLGLTSVQNANGSVDDLELYEQLQREGKLTLRVDFAMSASPWDGEETLRGFAALGRRYNGPFLRVGAIKIVLDGVIESHTAALLAPYANNAATSGKPAWTAEQFLRTVTLADRLGLQVFTHAIGDRAVRMALDGYAAAAKANGTRDARHRIEHIETIQPADMPRFAELGVLPSMQPVHADPSGIEIWAACLGPERAQRGFAWRSIEKAGGRLVFSSDWPASIALDPIRGIHTAVTRRTVSGLPEGGWLPGERVSVDTALRAYTVNSAYGSRQDAQKGVLKRGFWGDLVVLSQDLFGIPPEQIHRTAVDLTILDGRIVHPR